MASCAHLPASLQIKQTVLIGYLQTFKKYCATIHAF